MLMPRRGMTQSQIAAAIADPDSAIGQAVRETGGGGGSSAAVTLLPLQPGMVYDSSQTTPMTVGEGITYTVPAGKLIVLPLVFVADVTIESFFMLTKVAVPGGHASMVLFGDVNGLPGAPVAQLGETALPADTHGGIAEVTWAGSWSFPRGAYHVGFLVDSSIPLFAGNPALFQYGWGGAAMTFNRAYETTIAAVDDPTDPDNMITWYNFYNPVPRIFFRLAPA